MLAALQMVLSISAEFGFIIVFHDCRGPHGYVVKVINLLRENERLTIMLPESRRHLFLLLSKLNLLK